MQPPFNVRSRWAVPAKSVSVVET